MGVMVVCFRTNIRRDLIKKDFFWRCPFWMSDETCDLFIWYEDLRVKAGNEDESMS